MTVSAFGRSVNEWQVALPPPSMKRRLGEADVENVLALREAGRSFRQISVALKVPLATVA